jgi:hypothetical protein
MSVNHGRTAPRGHPDFDGEQVAVRLIAGREDRDLVQPEPKTLGGRAIDR